jgi:CrcB protein
VPALTIFLVALGGALGALSRTGLTEIFGGDTLAPETLAVTLAINTLGALLLSLLRRHSDRVPSPALVHAIGVGFLGAFTTWSAVMAITALSYSAGQTLIALVYLALTVVLGVGIALLSRGPKAEAS